MANDYEVVAKLGDVSVRFTAVSVMVSQVTGDSIDAVVLGYEEAVFVRDQIDSAIRSGHVLRKDQIAAIIKERRASR